MRRQTVKSKQKQAMARTPTNVRRKGNRKGRRSLVRVGFGIAAAGIFLFYLIVSGSLLLLRWIHPPTTAVQVERRIAAWRAAHPYTKNYSFVPLNRISPNLAHAAIAAEDARFFQHHGFDWTEVNNAVREDLEGGRRRGASTITQQLVRNLFLNTNASVVRKAIEFSIVPLAEGLLSKQRILELYLNVIEWGPGIYGAEAASRHYYQIPARALTKEQAVQLAALLPAPLRRKPGHVEWYAAHIRTRMHEMGW